MSLDNLSPNSAREGYVRDLRRQHKAAQQSHAAMDEGYPFMLTEARQVCFIVDMPIYLKQIVSFNGLQ